eukprot:scaffold111233_cov37-Tisochrysis_lutea.AAC.1
MKSGMRRKSISPAESGSSGKMTRTTSRVCRISAVHPPAAPAGSSCSRGAQRHPSSNFSWGVA